MKSVVMSMNNKPVRLGKQENFSFTERVDEWAISHAHIILPLCIIIALILFVALCYAIIGVSATDSGVQYNAMERII